MRASVGGTSRTTATHHDPGVRRGPSQLPVSGQHASGMVAVDRRPLMQHVFVGKKPGAGPSRRRQDAADDTSSVDLLPGSTMACASSRARRRRDGRRPAWVAAAIGPGLVVVSSLAVQLGAASSKDVLVVIAPGAVTGVRFSIAAAVLMVLARPRLRGRSRTQWAAIIGFGIVLALSNWSFTQAIARIPLGTAVALESVAPSPSPPWVAAVYVSSVRSRSPLPGCPH